MSCSDIQVTQQIDQLTSSIGLGEEERGEASVQCSPSESVSASEEAKHLDTSTHSTGYPNKPDLPDSRRLKGSSKDTQCDMSPSVAPPAYPTALLSRNNSGLKFNHQTTISQIKEPKTEANVLFRSQKPPPYPINSRTWRANKGNTPHNTGRRRLLSTTV